MSKSGASCHLDVPSSCSVCGNDTAVIETQMLLAIGRSKGTCHKPVGRETNISLHLCMLLLPVIFAVAL